MSFGRQLRTFSISCVLVARWCSASEHGAGGTGNKSADFFGSRAFPRLLELLILLLSSVPVLAGPRQADDRPNVILIYADDLGYGDLGCYGHPTIRTPHLDRMAAEGMRWTQFYSAAEVCTPSRTALLTGRYPIRSGMCHDQFRVLRNNSSGGLPQSELTLAELLKSRGYSTGMIGKWHLGHLPEHLPPQHGFDQYFGMPYSNDMLPAPDAPSGREKFYQENNNFWMTPLIRGTQITDPHPDQKELTRRYTEEAVFFIEDHREQPFFLYFAHTFPHVPLFASDRFRGKSPAGIYGDVVEELDWSVGRILQAVRDHGLEKNTLVIFSSDNGPWLIFNSHGGSAGLLKDGKGSTWEGGMRVPGIMWWPGRIAPGQVEQTVGTTMDVLPTIASLVSADVSDRVLDGIDLSPVLFGTGPVQRAAFMYYRGTRLFACRVGPWKAHFMTQPAYGSPKVETHDPPELYQLEIDPSERWNESESNPEVIAEIRRQVAQHQASLADVPTQLQNTVETAPGPTK